MSSGQFDVLSRQILEMVFQETSVFRAGLQSTAQEHSLSGRRRGEERTLTRLIAVPGSKGALINCINRESAAGLDTQVQGCPGVMHTRPLATKLVPEPSGLPMLKDQARLGGATNTCS